jgi:2-polyprenyl-3-methyl-5-hydroxy-6-metoxy-1,4-benzoquinol methylase
MNRSTQRALYENPRLWEQIPPKTVLERITLTLDALPDDVTTILEVGSGNGRLIKSLRNSGYDPVASDISSNALKHIHSAKRVQAEASDLPFPTDSFDLLLACELLEHIPVPTFNRVLDEIARVSQKYIIITTPYQEKLAWSYAHCPACGCIFNGAYHIRSFTEENIQSLFKEFKCISIREIVKILHPDRTTRFELFIRHQLASEYLYFGPSITCPLCLSSVDKRPRRNWIGYGASAIRYLYRLFSRKRIPLWYLAVFKRL